MEFGGWREGRSGRKPAGVGNVKKRVKRSVASRQES